MKHTLVKEIREGQDSKRQHEATISEFERLQKENQDLEGENDALELSVTIMEGEKKDLEDKVLQLEAQKSTENRQAGDLKAREEEIEVQNKSLETHLKMASERNPDITPFCNQSCSIRRNIHQVQLKLAEEIYKVKQAKKG